ncbi:FecR domain-containing protein [bacterium]|nr:FecR domain-containing protein [bacterium]
MNFRISLISIVILVGFLCSGCESQKQENDPIAFITKTVNGVAEVKRMGASEYVKVEGKTPLHEGDTIRTGEKAIAELQYSSGATGDILPNTEFQIEERKKSSTNISIIYNRLINGIAAFYVPKGNENAKKFQVATNRAVASIKGTAFKISHLNDKTTLTVKEGLVAFGMVESKSNDSTEGNSKETLDKDSAKTPPEISSGSLKQLEVGAFKQVSISKDGVSEVTEVNVMLDPDFAGFQEPEKFSK